MMLFMGEMADPEFEVWAGRGIRIYPCEPDEGRARLIEQWRAARKPDPRPGGSLTLTGGGTCVCGRCLFEWECPAHPKR